MSETNLTRYEPSILGGGYPMEDGQFYRVEDADARDVERLNTIALKDARIRELEEACRVLGDEVRGLRDNQRQLCDRCSDSGLGKRGRCYLMRMNTDAHPIASQYVRCPICKGNGYTAGPTYENEFPCPNRCPPKPIEI